MNKKSAVVILAVVAVIGFVGREDYQNAKIAEAEYCARVAAGTHTDYDSLCPAGTYNSYRGLPGDIADASAVNAPAEGCSTDSECEGIE